MKRLYFKYLKYPFLLFLIYTMYVLIIVTDTRIGYTEMIIGILFPYLPVWLSSLFAKKIDSDLVGTPLNIFALCTPAIVVLVEVYIIFILSLASDGTGAGLIGAFFCGTIVFFILFGINLMLSVFVKSYVKPYKQDF